MAEDDLYLALVPVLAAASEKECASPSGDWSVDSWRLLAESGIPWVGLPESLGGEGGDLADAYHVLHLAGYYGIRVPLLETAFVVGQMLAAVGRAIPREPMSWGPFGPTELRLSRVRHNRWIVNGCLSRVPWADQARWVLGTALMNGTEYGVLLDPKECRIESGYNLAREHRDTLVLDELEVSADSVFELPQGHEHRDLYGRGTVAKAVQMVGALEKVQELTIDYARQRHQFGRPIGRFQAISQNLALATEHVERAKLGVLTSAQIAAESRHDDELVARAKIMAGEATDVVTKIAHQIHGAIGVTAEYPLGQYTSQLWSWQQEYGSARLWASHLGELIIAGGPDSLWGTVTTCLQVDPDIGGS